MIMQIKHFLKLLCISDIAKRWGGKNLYDLIDKEIKGKYMVKNMSDLTKPQIRKHKIDRAKLIEKRKPLMYVHEDIAVTKNIKFRSDLGFNQINLILQKGQSVVIPLLTEFFVEEIKLQHKALKNERVRTDMYFSKHKFAVEIDKKVNTDRNQGEENERQTKIEKYSD